MKRDTLMLFLLSAAAGAVDAVCFLGFDVFTSAMSGNMVLLGIAIARRHLRPAVDSAVAFAFYALGAVAATALAGRTGRRVRWMLALETAALAGFAALAFAFAGATPPPAATAAMIALAAVGMGTQAIVARAFGVPGIVTVVFTSTLTTIAEAVCRRLVGRPAPDQGVTWRQVAALGFYIGGAIAGGLLFPRSALGAVLPVGCALLALIVATGPGAGREH